MGEISLHLWTQVVEHKKYLLEHNALQEGHDINSSFFFFIIHKSEISSINISEVNKLGKHKHFRLDEYIGLI